MDLREAIQGRGFRLKVSLAKEIGEIMRVQAQGHGYARAMQANEPVRHTAADAADDTLSVSENAADFQKRLDASKWFHSFKFSNGSRAAGRDPSHHKLRSLGLPDLTGKSVLDIGAYDGYFSFQAERLGAAKVTACDDYVWTHATDPSKQNFEFLRSALNSRVTDVTLPVENMSPSTVEPHDVVLFLGVLYHAPDMVDYLRRVHSVTKQMVIVETLVDRLDDPNPSAAYYPRGTLNGDSTNWWGPNIACVMDMMERVGFKSVQLHTMWEINTIDAIRGLPQPQRRPITSGRAVIHGYI